MPAAVVVSLLVHAGVLLPVLLGTLRPSTSRAMTEARLPADAARTPEVELGILESSASTMTWIGYEEYEEHMAALSTVEQAAFTMDPDQGVPVESAGEVPVVTTPSPPSPDQGSADAPGEGEQEAEVSEPYAVPTPTAEPAPVPAPIARIPPATTVESMQTMLRLIEQYAPVQEAPEQPDLVAVRPARDPSDREAPAEEPKDASSSSSASGRPAQPAPKSGDPDSAEPEPGEISDRRTPATSIVNFDEIRPGETLARQGLVLKPQKRLDLTTFQRLTLSPCNPTVSMDFNREGRVVRASVDKTSCDSRLDRAIVRNLYSWLAEGDALEDLDASATRTVSLEIIMR